MVRQNIFAQQSGGEGNKDNTQQQKAVGIHKGSRCFMDELQSGVVIHPSDEDDHETQEERKHGRNNVAKRQPQIMSGTNGRRRRELDIDDQ